VIVWLGPEECEDWLNGINLMLGIDYSKAVACHKKGLEDGVLGNHLWIVKEGENGCLAVED
jgi:hypothetical protein